MMISGITTAWVVQNSFGNVFCTEIDFPTEEGVIIHGTLQVPSGAFESNPIPGVVIIHGSMQAKEWMSAFSIELSRRNFVTLSIDAVGHGDSEYKKNISDHGGCAALEYLDKLNYISKIGMVGHSMGEFLVLEAINQTSVTVDAIVLVSGLSVRWTNSTFPNNLLVTVGKYDELQHIPSLIESLTDIWDTPTQVEVGKRYGTYTNGTARKLVISQTNHLFETIDPIIVGETVKWLEESIKYPHGGTKPWHDPHWIPKGDLVYPIFILGGLIASLGILLSFFPVFAILIDFPIFKDLKKTPSSSYAVSKRSYWIFGLIYTVIGLGLFLPAMFIRFIPFPQRMGSTIGMWLLGSSLIALFAFFFIYRYQRNQGISLSDLGVDNISRNNIKLVTKFIGKSVLLAILVFFWIICWVLSVDIFLALDFRAFLPLFSFLTLRRLLIFPLYLIFLIPFFVVEGIWVMGLLRTQKKDTWIKTQFSWTLKAIIIRCLVYIVILLVQLIGSLIIGSSLIPGMIGYYLIFLWMFTPFFALSTTISAWSYRLTNRIYVGAMINALIFSWEIAAILALAI